MMSQAFAAIGSGFATPRGLLVFVQSAAPRTDTLKELTLEYDLREGEAMASTWARRLTLEASDGGLAAAFAPHPDVPQSTEEIIALMRAPIRILSRRDKMRTISRLFRWQGRYRTTRHFLVIVGALNALAALFDLFEHGAGGILAARAAITACCIAAAVGLRRLRGPSTESALAMGPLLFCLALAGTVPLAAQPDAYVRYLDQALFVVGSGLSLLVVDYLHLLVAGAVAIGLASLSLALSDLPAIEALQSAVFYLTGFAALLNVRRISMTYRNRNIVHYFRCELQRRKLADLTEQLNKSATTDQLTGLGNRHLFMSILGQLPRTARIALLMIDIDRFKVLNDTLGHSAGDMCLVAVAKAIERRIEGRAHAMRFGGEEFVVCAPDLDLAAAEELAEQIRRDVASAPICTSLTVTVSAGVALGPIEEVERLLREADDALYRAKADGRNRVCLAHRAGEIAEPPRGGAFRSTA